MDASSCDRGSTNAGETPIGGRCDPAFAAVEAAFRENFRSHDELGAAVCVRVGGRVVVDLWGGHTDETRRHPWTRETLVNAYSVGKGITAMLVLSLVERGELDLDEPLRRRWPELGAEGKERTTLRMLLAHRGGLPGVRRTLDDGAMLEWDTMTSALAAQAPWWEPGQDHGYHVNTLGFLVGEPVVRALGCRFSEALRRCVTGPLDADFHIGLPRREHRRVACISERRRADGTTGLARTETEEVVARFLATGDAERDAMLPKVYFNPPGLSGFGIVNSEGWRCAAIPSTNGHGTARAVAALYDAFSRLGPESGGLVGPGLRHEATRIHSDGPDRVLGRPSRFGLGFQLSQPARPLGGAGRGYGHFGYGGSLGFADPDGDVAFGYLMNRPGERWLTPRSNALVDAVYGALGHPRRHEAATATAPLEPRRP